MDTKYHCGITMTVSAGSLFQRVVQGQIYRWENGKVTKHTLSLDGYDCSEGIFRSRHRPHCHDPRSQWQGADEESCQTRYGHPGGARSPPLPGMGEELKLRWLPGTQLSVQGNGEILSDDFAQLINRNTRECRYPSGNAQDTWNTPPMTVVSSPGGSELGRFFVIPSTSGASLGQQRPKKLEWREYKEVYPNLPIFLPSRPRSEKSFSKRQPDNPGGGIYTGRSRSWRKSWGPAHIVLQNGTRKSTPERVPIPRRSFCGTNLDYRAGWTKMSRPSKPLVLPGGAQGELCGPADI